MNRRQKIIVSVTGIFLVLLILVGLTYAYFLTQIAGNDKDKSISASTENLALVYGNDDGSIIGDGEIIEPGKTFEPKTFTVENTGNGTVEDYAVILEDVINPLVRTQDMEMTLTCVSSISGKSCEGIEGSLPNQNDILVMNSIDEDELQTYELTLKYLEPGEDQSVDMNKTIEGKINIIDTHNTLDLIGTVTNYVEGDYVQTNSVQRISQIDDEGNYKLVGLEPGNHTIRVYSSDGTEKGSQQIEIVKGEESGIKGNVITIIDSSRTLDINIDVSAKTYEIGSIKVYNPYKDGTLAYNILNDASNSSDITVDFSEKTEKKVGYQVSTSTYGKTNPTSYPTVHASTSPATKYYLAYACDYSIDSNGNFILGSEDCPVTKTGKYSKTDALVSSLKGKFAIFSGSAAGLNAETFTTLYKITDDENSFTDTSFNYVTVNKYVSTEKVLSKTKDEYGDSYYYRGGVENNYVNFAGMCWRIVRIQGDGSIKLVLEDQDNECESANGNWNIPVSNESGASLTGYFGYTQNSNGQYLSNYLNSDGNATNYEKSLGTALKNFQTNKLGNYLNVLKSGDWCYPNNAYSNKLVDVMTATPLTETEKSTFHSNEEVYYYDTYVRLFGSSTKTPSLKCNGTKMNVWGDNTTPMYVSSLTADEIVYAGADVNGTANNAYYLLNDYQRARFLFWWSMSPRAFNGTHESEYGMYGDGRLSGDAVSNDNGYRSFRPAVSLVSGIKIASGDGTKSNPYTIN